MKELGIFFSSRLNPPIPLPRKGEGKGEGAKFPNCLRAEGIQI
jgi:hypothetical protein